ncbi:MAG: deaminase [Sedimentisphaerales bacterium]|jgi:deoxycytidylate deaminase/dephospho-CoA kinase
MTTPSPHVIGLTGSFGSGCTYVAQNILQTGRGYKCISLSNDILKPLFREKTGKDPSQCLRHELQEFGDEIRQDASKGSGYLADEAIRKINSAKDPNGTWVVDSIKNPAEIHSLRSYFPNFFLLGVHAERETRWTRSQKKYKGNWQAFNDDDSNDTGDDNPIHGQRVGDCFYESDIVITNQTDFTEVGNIEFTKFSEKLFQYVDLLQKPLGRQQPLKHDEALMAMAYAMSQRSSCLQRKVGALIADDQGNIISSGYNEVPPDETPCVKEYTKCHRKWLIDNFFATLSDALPEAKGKEGQLKSLFRKQFKILDYCRALHAEENALMNLVRHGKSISLERCTLYTTTYPCRMCANKIVKSGIRNIVYIEPYPDEAAKQILEHAGVKWKFFEGVTYRSYFRLYGEEK